MSDLIRNERVKYAATFFNNSGVAAFASGIILPVFADMPTNTYYVAAAVGFVLGVVLMLTAQWTLGQMKE